MLLSTVKFIWKGLKSRKLCIYFQIVPCLQYKTCYELIMINYTVSLPFLTGPKDRYVLTFARRSRCWQYQAGSTHIWEGERAWIHEYFLAHPFGHVLTMTGQGVQISFSEVGWVSGGNLKMGCWLWQLTFWGMINLSSIASLRVNVYWM